MSRKVHQSDLEVSSNLRPAKKSPRKGGISPQKYPDNLLAPPSLSSSPKKKVITRGRRSLNSPRSSRSESKHSDSSDVTSPKEKQQSVTGSTSSLLNLALQRHWNEFELRLRYLSKSSLQLHVIDDETGYNPLMLAARDNKLNIVERLLELGMNINSIAKTGETAMHFAAASAKEEIVNLFINKKAILTQKVSSTKRLPLHVVCGRNGNSAVNVTQAIIRATPRNLRLHADYEGNIPLFIAIAHGNQGACRELLRSNQEDQLRFQHSESRDTALHLAINKRDTELIKFLLGRGSRASTINKLGETPIHLIAGLGDLPLLEQFCQNLSEIDSKVFDDPQNSPLHVATLKGHSHIVEYISEKFPESVFFRTQEGSTLMHVALERGFNEIAHMFLKRGVLVHMPNKDGEASLHTAARNNRVSVLRSLLLKGACVNARTKDDLTALHIAAKNANTRIVRTLLGFGASVDVKGGRLEETAMHLASQSRQGSQVVDLLIKSGADVNSERVDGQTALHMAARSGNLRAFKLILKEGGDCRRGSKVGESPLHIAVKHCHLEIVEFLLKFLSENFAGSAARQCVNAQDEAGETSLHFAASIKHAVAHFDEEEVKIMQLLLHSGGNPNLATHETKETSLHYCARAGNTRLLREMLETIKRREVSSRVINNQSKNGYSPLLHACEQGHVEGVQLLLECGARVDIFDEEGKAALHLAAEHGHYDIVAMLLRRKTFINAKTKLGLTPLHLAAQQGFDEIVLLLVNARLHERQAMVDAVTLDKKTALHEAAERGKFNVCWTLLEAGADVEAIDSAGETALHLAAENDHSQVVEMFLRYRHDLVTIANKSGWTCAHIAAFNGSVSVISELLKSSFRREILAATSTTSQSTPLHIATEKGHVEVVRELLLNGADPFHEDANGFNVMHLAARRGHTELVDVIDACAVAIRDTTGADLPSVWGSISSKSGYNVLHISAHRGHEAFAKEMLMRLDAGQASQPPGIRLDKMKESSKDWGFTPLHLAALSGHVSLVGLILNYETVDVRAATFKQRVTPLHLAAGGGFVDVVELLLTKTMDQIHTTDISGNSCLHYAAINSHVEMAALLLGRGADIDRTEENGMTALHYAGRAGCLRMMKLLVDAGACTMALDKDKKSPVQFAAAYSHPEVVKLLLRYKHDSDKLIDDKNFVYNLMTLAKSAPNHYRDHTRFDKKEMSTRLSSMLILDEFIMASHAPVYTASRLSRAFTLSSSRVKEHGKSLQDCAEHCEQVAVDLLEICSGEDRANEVLRARDNTSKAFLDTLIECEQKEVIASPNVQKYLSEIWVGGLTWSDWKFGVFLLAIVVIFPLWIFLSLPLHYKFNKLPIIKFIAHLVSHIYLVVLFVITVAIPLKPIYKKADLAPTWNEVLLLVWMTGVVVNEITNRGTRSGVARARIAMLFLCASAVLIHVITFTLPYNANGDSVERQEALYIRNMFLSTAMIFAFVLFLDFLSFHYLFGPWSIIIEGLLNDLFKFGVIVLLFMFAFSMWLSAVYQPVYGAGANNSFTIYGVATTEVTSSPLNPLNAFPILFYALFGLVDPGDLPAMSQSPFVAIYIVQFVYGIYHIVTIIVLINLLIAMMSDTYQRIQENSDREWKFGRAKLIRNMKKNKLSPSPVNLFVLGVHYARRCCRNYCQYLASDVTKSATRVAGEACDVGAVWDLAQDHSDDSPLKLTENSTGRISRFRGASELVTLENVVDWNLIRQKFFALAALKGASPVKVENKIESFSTEAKDHVTKTDESRVIRKNISLNNSCSSRSRIIDSNFTQA